MLTHGQRPLLAALAALAALSPSLALGADNTKLAAPGTKPANAAKAPNERPAQRAEALKLKTFTLKRANPQVVQQALLQVWPRLSASRGAGVPGQQMPHLACTPRTHTLFVRGSQDALDTVAELIGLLEGDSDKDTESLKNLSVVRLRHAAPQEVQQVLQQLGLQETIIALPQTSLVIVLKSGSDAQEVEEVIRQVDRPTYSEKTGQKTTGADGKQPRK